MKKLLVILALVLLAGCSKEVTVKKEIPATPESEYETAESIVRIAYSEMSDGTFTANGTTYKERLVITGHLPSSERGMGFTVLSNIGDIDFDRAWRAFTGLSSNTADYFDPKDAICVETKW